MTLTKQEIAWRIAKYGTIWRPEPARSSDIDTPDGFAATFMSHIGLTLNGVAAQKCPGMGLNFVLVDNPGVNAFAARNKLESNNYIIGICRGVFDTMMDFFYDRKVISAALSYLPISRYFGLDSIPRHCMNFAATFITFHEFVHISRGHIGYAKAMKLEQDEIAEVTPMKDARSDRIRFLLECDADTRGGRYAAAQLLTQINELVTRVATSLVRALRDTRGPLPWTTWMIRQRGPFYAPIREPFTAPIDRSCVALLVPSSARRSGDLVAERIDTARER